MRLVLFKALATHNEKYINNFSQYIQKDRGEKGEEKKDNYKVLCVKMQMGKSMLYISFP